MAKVNGGLFIVVEGADGSGKTTVSKEITERLNGYGYTVSRNDQPGGTGFGQDLRKFHKETMWLPDEVRSQIMMMSMTLAAKKDIPEALNNNNIIIIDRWIRSTYVYQRWCTADYNRRKLFVDMEQWCLGDFIAPDYEIILQAPLEVCYERRYKRNITPDAIESRGIEFFKHVNTYYKQENDTLDIGRNYPKKWYDTNCELEMLITDITNDIIAIIKAKAGGENE